MAFQGVVSSTCSIPSLATRKATRTSRSSSDIVYLRKSGHTPGLTKPTTARIAALLADRNRKELRDRVDAISIPSPILGIQSAEAQDTSPALMAAAQRRPSRLRRAPRLGGGPGPSPIRR